MSERWQEQAITDNAERISKYFKPHRKKDLLNSW